MGLKEDIEKRFKRKVDLATPDMIKPLLWKYINKDLVNA